MGATQQHKKHATKRRYNVKKSVVLLALEAMGGGPARPSQIRAWILRNRKRGDKPISLNNVCVSLSRLAQTNQVTRTAIGSNKGVYSISASQR